MNLLAEIYLLVRSGIAKVSGAARNSEQVIYNNF